MRPEEASGRPVGGVDYPRNFAEFEAFFSTERECLLYLARLRWPDGFRCPACAHEHYWLRDDGLLLCCQCRRKTSVTAGTIFDKSRLGLRKWFQVIWYVVNQTGGVSALGLQRVLGFGSYETAWAWLQKLRRAMEPTSGKLRGDVEVDEVFVGGVEAGVTGRETMTKSKVVIAVERRGPRMAAGRARDAAYRDLRPRHSPRVHPGCRRARSKVITDGWGGYKRVGAAGYIHEAHNISRSGKQAHELMPAVHRVSALVKRWLLGTHQGAVGPEHLDWYLAEWCFRFNRRYSRHRGLLFHNLVRQAATTPPHPYGDLLTKRTGKKFKRETRKQRELRAEGVVGHRRNLPRENPRRPGGARTRLDDDAVRRRRRVVPGRRGRRA